MKKLTILLIICFLLQGCIVIMTRKRYEQDMELSRISGRLEILDELMKKGGEKK